MGADDRLLAADSKLEAVASFKTALGRPEEVAAQNAFEPLSDVDLPIESP